MFLYVLSFIGLTLGSWEDLRTREVPDWLTFSMMFLGVGSAIIFSIVYSDSSFLIMSMSGLAFTIIFSLLMYYSGQWGGGDSKLLMGLGAMIGIDFNAIADLPFMLTLVINIFLIGAVYALAWSVSLALRNWESFKKEFGKILYSKEVTKLRKGNLSIAVGFMIGIFLAPLHFKIILFTIMVLLFMTLYLYIFVKSIEHSCMIKEYDINKLTEGDWIAEEVKVKGKRICGPKDLGVTEDQIKELKQLKKKGLIKKVIVKEGVPFVPSFLLAFIATWYFGNWFIKII